MSDRQKMEQAVLDYLVTKEFCYVQHTGEGDEVIIDGTAKISKVIDAALHSTIDPKLVAYFSQINDKYRDILRHAAAGWPAKAISRETGVPQHSVNAYLQNMRRQTGARNMTQLIIWADRAGVLF